MNKRDTTSITGFKNPTFRLLVSLLILSLALPTIVSAAAHPNLLFTDITEVPGYQYRSSSPWDSWEGTIISSAETSLTRDFSDPDWTTQSRLLYRSAYASDLALAYQITKEQKYFDKAKEALLNLDVGEAWYSVTRSTALREYSLSYDWIQPALTPAEDEIIRDKLAILADQAYRDLNADGTRSYLIQFADYHGQAYPNVAIAGVALEDYTNPNNIALSSGPDDWIKTGTDYLFVNDKLHIYDRPMISYGFDDASGKTILGAYNSYFIGNIITWFQVYSNHYDRNILEDYPMAKKIVTSELWETLPNGYMNNCITSGNTLRTYHRGIISLLDEPEQGEVLKYLDQTKGNKLLPYSKELDQAPVKLLYCVYDNYDSVSRESPEWTSHLDENAMYQVFREDWEEDSDWLSLVTFNIQTNSNRDMAHHDQLSFEYYSRGDLLLADAGEIKYITPPDNYYGQYAVHQNGVAIEDPRTPFAVSSRTDSQARGVYKGGAASLNTPVTVNTIIQTPWMEGISASETIIDVIEDMWANKKTLTSPIDYSRKILYPDDDYFVIFDSLEGDEEWTYRNVFRPTSLSVTPTGSGVIGNVHGDLSIDGTAYNWLSLPYKDETKTGITTNTLTWDTTNPYGDPVELNIYSVPASEVIVTKHIGRIGGYDSRSEVYSPIVYLKDGPERDLYRITVLASSYQNEEQKNIDEIPVTGNGNAIQVSATGTTDTIYSGNGDSTFGVFSTDAEIAFIRTPSSSQDYSITHIKGTYLNKNGAPLIKSTGTESISLNKEGNSVAIVVDGSSTGQVSVYQLNTDIKQVLKDGVPYTGWQLSEDKTAIIITTAAGNHEYSFLTSGEVMPVPTGTEAGFTASPTEGQAPLPVQFTDTSTNAVSWSWDFGDGAYSEEKDPSHTYADAGTYTVTLVATGIDGSDTKEKTNYISVTEENNPAPVTNPPVAAFSADIVSGTVPLKVEFTDESTNTPDSWSWNFGDGWEANVPNPSHTYTQPGTYSVTLTVTNDDGSDTEEKSGYITITEEVTPPPVTNPPVAAFSADVVSGTTPLEVTFTDESSNSPDSWSWNFGDGTTASEENPHHVYTQSGSYTVTLEVTNEDGSDTETKTSLISVTTIQEPSETTKPVADFMADAVTGDAPLQVSFTDKSEGVPTSWKYYFGDGETSNEQNPSYTYTKPGTYSVILKAINAKGTDFEYKKQFITVTENAGPVPVPNPPVAAFNADVVSGTAPLEVTFTDESTNTPDSWSWNFGDGTGAQEENPNHVYIQPGTYTVTLEVTNGDGSDTETKTEYISVEEEYIPNPPVAAFNADVVSGTAPLEVTFTDESTNTPDSWSWNFGDGTHAQEENPNHVYTQPGTYTVTLKVTNGDGSDTETKTDYISVEEEYIPNPPVAAFSADVVSGTAPLEVTFTDESTNTPDSWSWNFGDGTGAQEENPNHVYTQPGTYTVTLEVTNGDGSDIKTKTGFISVNAVQEPSETTIPVAAFTADVITGPAPLQVSFTDQSQGVPTSWKYYFGDGGISTEQNPTHTYTKPGTYSVILKAINTEGNDFEYKKGYIVIG